MPNLFLRCMFFISSYFPLTLIFSIMLWDKGTGGKITAIVVLAIGILSVIYLLMNIESKRRRISGFHRKATDIQVRDGDVMSYIASYVIPFITFEFTDWKLTIALVIFLLVLALLYINSGMIYINPMLNLAGYHLYEVTLEPDSISYYLIARSRLKRGAQLYLIPMSDGVFLEKSRTRHGRNTRETSTRTEIHSGA